MYVCATILETKTATAANRIDQAGRQAPNTSNSIDHELYLDDHLLLASCRLDKFLEAYLCPGCGLASSPPPPQAEQQLVALIQCSWSTMFATNISFFFLLSLSLRNFACSVVTKKKIQCQGSKGVFFFLGKSGSKSPKFDNEFLEFCRKQS